MEPGHPHVVQPHHLVAQGLGGEGGLLGHRHVAGAAGGHHDLAGPVGGGQAAHDADAAHLVVGEGVGRVDGGGRLGGHAGDEDRILSPGPHGVHDLGDLLRGLARAVDHLGHPLAEPPVAVQLGKAQLLKGLQLQLEEGVVHLHLSGGHLLQQGLDRSLFHSALLQIQQNRLEIGG